MVINSSSEAEAAAKLRITIDTKHDFVIQPQKTQERDFGWVVFFTTRKFSETGNPSYLVPGTGPIVVMRDGEVVFLTSSVPPNIAISVFETEWRNKIASIRQ